MEKPSKRTEIITCGAIIISVLYYLLVMWKVISPHLALPITILVISALYLILNRNEKIKSRVIYFVICLVFIAMGISASFV